MSVLISRADLACVRHEALRDVLTMMQPKHPMVKCAHRLEDINEGTTRCKWCSGLKHDYCTPEQSMCLMLIYFFGCYSPSSQR